MKFFVDDDDQLPSLCSTGLEDYAGGAWAFQDALRSDPEPTVITFSAPYCGYPFYSTRDTTRAAEFATATMPMHGLYRWHLPDPIHFDQRLKVTVQQIGTWQHDLFERQDDVATTAYWYPRLHPESRYFGIGKIDRDQVADYAARKGWTVAEAERWLAQSLDYDPTPPLVDAGLVVSGAR